MLSLPEIGIMGSGVEVVYGLSQIVTDIHPPTRHKFRLGQQDDYVDTIGFIIDSDLRRERSKLGCDFLYKYLPPRNFI